MAAPAASLPEPLRALAQRLGAEALGTAAAVTLEQRGWMRDDARSPERRFTAHQRIELTRPAFIWRARCGPLRAIRIEDALIALKRSRPTAHALRHRHPHTAWDLLRSPL
ncbi:MAG TPA: DUF6544 family protein [Steroidobacteraceae bacterium]|nr:DUF6544 family protein [Steroidobacteraceae bacterium]